MRDVSAGHSARAGEQLAGFELNCFLLKFSCERCFYANGWTGRVLVVGTEFLCGGLAVGLLPSLNQPNGMGATNLVTLSGKSKPPSSVARRFGRGGNLPQHRIHHPRRRSLSSFLYK